MIHIARPTVSPVVNVMNIVFAWNLFCFKKWGTDGRTEDVCKNNDHYRPRLWVGRVDQKQQKTMFAIGVTMGLAEWINDDTCLVTYFIYLWEVWTMTFDRLPEDSELVLGI